jgi:hypothetical protein
MSIDVMPVKPISSSAKKCPTLRSRPARNAEVMFNG